MTTRLTRAEQVGRNRERVLEAARRVFLARGYAGASLDAIAEEAGFSKGVVYSQFDGKADLLLTLLDRRITERAEQNAQAMRDAAGSDPLIAMLRLQDRSLADNAAWAGLVIEFRVLAAREPELNARYAAAHARAVDALAANVAEGFAKSGAELPEDPRVLAEFMFAVSSGLALERATNADALPQAALERIAARVFDQSPPVGHGAAPPG